MAVDLPLPAKLVLLSVPEALLVKHFVPDQDLRVPITPIVLLLAAINFCVWAFYRVLIYPFFVSPFRHLPGPVPKYPIIANGPVVMARPPGGEFLNWVKTIPNDGLIRFRGFFNVDRIIPTHPRTIADVLVHNSYDFEKPARLRSFLRRILGDGLIMVEGDEHRFQRKNIMPSFSFRHVKDLYPVFWAKAVALTDAVAAEAQDDPVVEINHWSTKVTLDIIGLAALGRDFHALKKSDDPLVATYEEVLEPTREKTAFFALHMLGLERVVRILPWRINEVMRDTTTQLKQICQQLLADKKAASKTEGEEQPKDILSVMMRSNLFGDDMLIDQLLTFLAAGHETTSSAFTWACYLLAVHPAAQSRLRAEVLQANLSSSSSPDHLPSSSSSLADKLEAGMPYLNGVCNETTRLYPTVPVTLRDAVRDTRVGGQRVPRGTQVLLSPWAVNRSPALWGADAESFRPERWIDDDEDDDDDEADPPLETGGGGGGGGGRGRGRGGGRGPRTNNHGGASSNYCLLTFLHGPRSCIGQRFAQAELRALVAAFVGRFEWTLAMDERDVVPAGVVTTKPMNGMRLRVRGYKA
ncbi:cytochrome p450 [Diplodia corticola]|uniref:Cytochrome p450 n=1 Tax=Diplodia corticola TaxID=236234 RepID=A0A1J9S654_9PEZI|nr:cytochrome p450 [Diplodia corticola]OJD40427.1 cytochrome p450 [Diplodia corticola]